MASLVILAMAGYFAIRIEARPRVACYPDFTWECRNEAEQWCFSYPNAEGIDYDLILSACDETSCEGIYQIDCYYQLGYAIGYMSCYDNINWDCFPNW